MLFEILSNNIHYVIDNSKALVGLGLPFCLSLLFLSFDKNKINYRNIIALMLITICCNSLSTKISSADGLASLSFTSFSIFILGGYAWYQSKALSVYKVFYFTFFTSLVTDIISAPNSWQYFLNGIGGAGWGDGLLIIPVIYTLTFILLDLIRRRQSLPALLYYN